MSFPAGSGSWLTVSRSKSGRANRLTSRATNPHGAETLEAAVVIDTFSPPREDYLAIDEKARAAQR